MIRKRRAARSPSSASARRSRPRCSRPPTSSTPGVPSIWAKALSPEHARILDRIGVHHVISPEADTGRRVAHLVNGKLLDYIEFDDGFAIVKMQAAAGGDRLHAGAERRSAASTA